MTIPRPSEQRPVDFRRDDWSSNVDLRKTFFDSPLEHRNFLKILFQHVDTKSSLGVLVPWTWLLRPPHINSDHDDDNDHEWRPVRIPGSGAFGVVSLWRKEKGSDIIDEVAIKEAARPQGDEIEEAGPADEPLVGLPKEAVINEDLNSHSDSENIGFLRNFRFYDERSKKDKDKGTYRFYFNFCPYDNLDTLARRYRMWDQWLPELFIWHVLIQLIHGVKTLEKPPPFGTLFELSSSYRNWFTIHLDLKPQNVLLDYPSEEGQVPTALDINGETPDYPDIRISDFGLTAYTSLDDDENPDNLDGGTDGYKPPEQTHQHDKWGEGFDQPPNNDVDKWTEAHNIWCVGKTVFDLMTLETQGRVDQLRSHTDNEGYIDRGQHFLQKDWGNKDFWESQSQEQHLSQLILEAESDALLVQKADKSGTEKGGKVSNGPAAVLGHDTIGPLPASTVLKNSRVKGVTQDDIDKIKQNVIQDRRARVAKVEEKRRGEDDLARQAEQLSAAWRSRQYLAMADHWPYSAELRDLVRAMLDPVPESRIDSDDILEKARAGYRATIEKYQRKDKSRKQSQRQPNAGSVNVFQKLGKVHFRETDINAMGGGKGNYQPDAEEYQRLLNKCDPDWEPLKPPQAKWRSFTLPFDPDRPQVRLYEGSTEIPGKRIKVRLTAGTGSKATVAADDSTKDLSTACGSLPTATDYRLLNHTELANEVAGRIRALDVPKQGLQFRNEHTVEALIAWLMKLDSDGIRGNDPRVKAGGASQASSSASSKRQSEDLDHDDPEPARPSKKRAKGKEKAKESVCEQDEQEDMYGEEARPNPDSELDVDEVGAFADESLLQVQKQPKIRDQKQDAGRRGKKSLGAVGHADEIVPEPANSRRDRTVAKKATKTQKGVQDPQNVAANVQGDGLIGDPQQAVEEQPARRPVRTAKQNAKAAIAQTARADQRRGARVDDEQRNLLRNDNDEVSEGEQPTRKRKGPPTKRKAKVKAESAPGIPNNAAGKGQKKKSTAEKKVMAAKGGK